MCGFPGETKEEFEETYNFLEEIKFYKIHVFKYSKREGTKAANLPNQVSSEIKEERSRKIIDLSKKMQEQYNKQYIGKIVKVLIEENEGKYYRGHTENYLNVYIESEEDIKENDIVEVKINVTENEILLGKLISKQM